MKVKKFYEPVYRYELIFVTDCSWEEANKSIKRFGLPSIPLNLSLSTGVTLVLSEKDFPKRVKGEVAFIWVKSKKDFYCLLHEVAHLLIKIFEIKGMDIKDDTTEPFAYYQEYWFRTLWRFMAKK